MSRRQEARRARVAAHYARKRAAAGNDPARLCAYYYDATRALIEDLPAEHRPDAYRQLGRLIRDFAQSLNGGSRVP